jgi:hypothetical protein
MIHVRPLDRAFEAEHDVAKVIGSHESESSHHPQIRASRPEMRGDAPARVVEQAGHYDHGRERGDSRG